VPLHDLPAGVGLAKTNLLAVQGHHHRFLEMDFDAEFAAAHWDHHPTVG